MGVSFYVLHKNNFWEKYLMTGVSGFENLDASADFDRLHATFKGPEFGPDYISETFEYLARDIKPDNPDDIRLLRPEFRQSIGIILTHYQELIEMLPLSPISVIDYLNAITYLNDERVDLRSYSDVVMYADHLLGQQIQT
jgi:hypothetical protein